MITLLSLGTALAVVLVLVYSTLVFFSHTPRKPFPSETYYITNDNTSDKHELPSRIRPDTNRKGTIEVSVVIPCYNETKRLGVMLEEAVDHLETYYTNQYEILIVDDGSSDNTDKFALKMADTLEIKPHTLKVIKLEKNRGKGGAVTHGFLHTQGKIALFADADGATKFSDMEKLAKFFHNDLKEGEPGVAVGSRAHMVNTDAVVKRSFIRNFLMYGLHTLVFIFGIRSIHDTQCGFKMFNQSSIEKIFPHMHTERWIFDVEVLLLAELQKIKLKEIAVNWQEIDGSKIDLAKDSIGMAIDLVVTRLAYILGIYRIDTSSKKNV